MENAVGEQRRRDRVAREGGNLAAVESDDDWLFAIDQAALREPVRLAHRPSPSVGAALVGIALAVSAGAIGAPASPDRPMSISGGAVPLA